MSKKLSETSERHIFFKERLQELGMYDKDSDYNGMIGKSVEELSEVFANQGHSGSSAVITLGLFTKLFNEYENPSNEKIRKFAEMNGVKVPDVFKEGQPEFFKKEKNNE